uniref:AT14183p n=1 Tax=Drosophila melanogaster TaxID=7227 RepID=Q8T462_DROME|nr:AT14183p [Drosophila melanogaster]
MDCREAVLKDQVVLEELSPTVVKPSKTLVANNGRQPAASATKGKKHKKSPCSPGDTNAGQVISSADADAYTNTKAKKQKKCHSGKDNNGYQAARSQDNQGSSGNKQESHNSTAITSNSSKTSNGLQGMQPAPAISQWIQSRNHAAHASVSNKSEKTAGGSQSRVQSNVASISSPAMKATSNAAIPTPAERAERSHLRRNRKWILSRDVNEDAVALVSSGDEETTAADDGQTERTLNRRESNPFHIFANRYRWPGKCSLKFSFSLSSSITSWLFNVGNLMTGKILRC